MQLYLRKLHALYIWLLAALTDVGVAMPWILLFYWGFAGPDWNRAIPGIWLALVVYGAAALWESGDRRESENLGSGRRLAAMVVGVVAAYLAAYFLMPAGSRTGLISINPALSYVPAAIYLWFMGARTITDGLTYTRLFPRYPYQCAAAAAGVAILAKTGGLTDTGVRVLLYWSVMLVLACGLLALVGAREQALKAGQTDIGEKATGNSGLERLLGFVVLGLVILTLGASYLVTSDRMGAFAVGVRNSFEGVWNSMMAVVWLIFGKYVIVIGYLLDWAIKLVRMMMHPFRPRTSDTGEVATDREVNLFKDIDQSPYKDWSPYVKLITFMAAMIIALVMVYRLTRRKRQSQNETEEEIVSLGVWPNLMHDLKGLFARRQSQSGGQAEPERLDARDPRMLFRRLQAWGAAIGRPRAASETPSAYGGALGTASPADSAAAGAVTAVYNQARYGATPPNVADVDVAAGAIDQLEKDELPKP